MSDCTFLERCPFFNDRMASQPATADIVKKRYCRDDWSACARHMVATRLGREHVPADLYPDQAERARELLAAAPVA